MRLRRATLEEIELPLVEPFRTSFGVERRRRLLLLSLEERGGEVGYAECVAAREPLYSAESVETARGLLLRHLLPAVLSSPDVSPQALPAQFARIKGHPMAKATVEMALHDLSARLRGLSLSRALGGRRRRVEVGVSVGIQPDPASLAARVGRYLEEGYRRIKLKVDPGSDVEYLSCVRRAHPDVTLWVDANQAYAPEAVASIRRWATAFRVAQVEQPFPERAIEAHARLQRGAPFLVCLDESVTDPASLEDAIARRAFRSLNVKPGRVGGLGPALLLARRSRASGRSAWVGGMLETGIGRAHNVALASVGEFDLPGDLSASARYFPEEIVDPPFVLGPGSTLEVPRGPGIGVEPLPSRIARHLRWRRLLTPKAA